MKRATTTAIIKMLIDTSADRAGDIIRAEKNPNGPGFIGTNTRTGETAYIFRAMLNNSAVCEILEEYDANGARIDTAPTFSQKCRTISRAFEKLHYMQDDDELRREGLTLSDYNAALDTFGELTKPGAVAYTFIAPVAEFFRRCGYEVKPDGVNYKISC